MTRKELLEGKEFCFETPELSDDVRVADVMYIDTISKFCIFFNGKLFSFKTFDGMKKKLDKLIKDWKLEQLHLDNVSYKFIGNKS